MLNIRSIKLVRPSLAVNSNIQAQNLQISEINAADAIEVAATNLNDADDATINANVPTKPATPSNLNSPTTTATTNFDAS
jgi:hypothetical protein